MHDVQLTALRRARLLRRLMPATALAAAGLAYGLHHTGPFSGHGLNVAALALAVVGAVALIPAVLVRTAERQLPLVVVVGSDGADLRPVEADDLDFCAALQAETLPHGFFVELGHRYLRSYLATFVDSPHATALLLTTRSTPVGMVVGILRPRAHRRWVMRHRGPRLALLGIAALAVRPRLAWRFARTRVVRYRRAWSRGAEPAPADVQGEPAVLSHVAVAPGAQGAGFGSLLVEAFVAAARAEGSTRVVLVTLAGEAGAAGFYRRRGWIENGDGRDLDGDRMVEFVLPLEAASG